MNFQEADYQYQWYLGLFQSGQINEEQFRQEVEKIRVIDEQGYTWMKQVGSGQWFVWQENQWQPGVGRMEDASVKQHRRAGWLIPVVVAVVLVCCLGSLIGGGLWAIRNDKLPWLKSVTANLPLVGEKSSEMEAEFVQISSASLTDGAKIVVGSENMQVEILAGALAGDTTAQVIGSQIDGKLALAFQETFSQEITFYELQADAENDGTGQAHLQVPASKEFAVLLEILDEKYLAVSELRLESGAFQANVPVGSVGLDQRDESVSLEGSRHFAIVQLDASALSSMGAHLARVAAAPDPRSCGIETMIGKGYMIPYPPDTVTSYCRKNLAGTIQVMVYPLLTPGVIKEKVDPVVDMIEKIMAFYQKEGFTAVNLQDAWLSRVQVVIELGSGDPYYSSSNGVVHIPEDSLKSTYEKNVEYELAHELAHWIQDESYNFTSAYWANFTGVSSEAKWWFEVAAENMVMLYQEAYIDHNLLTYGMTTPGSNDTPFQYTPNQWNDQLYLHAQLVKLFMCPNDLACPLSKQGFIDAINQGEYPYTPDALAKINENLGDYATYLLGKQVLSANSAIPIGSARASGQGYGEFINVTNKGAVEIEYKKTGYPPQMEAVLQEGMQIMKINAPIQKLGVYSLTISAPNDERQAGFPVEVVVESGVPFWYTLDDGKEKFHDGNKKISLGPIHSSLGNKKLRMVAYAQDKNRTFIARVQPLDLKGDWLVVSDGVTNHNYSCTETEKVEVTVNYPESAQFAALYTSYLPSAVGLFLPDTGGTGYTWTVQPGADLTFGGNVPVELSGALLLDNQGIQLQSKLIIPEETASLPASTPLWSGVPLLGILGAVFLRRQRMKLLTCSLVCCLVFLTGCVGFGGLYGSISTDTRLISIEEVGGRTIQAIVQSANSGVVADDGDEDSADEDSSPAGFPALSPRYVFRGTATATFDLHLLSAEDNNTTDSTCTGTINYKVIAIFVEDGLIKWDVD